jgi:ribose-phosphate pyrophosphokinase
MSHSISMAGTSGGIHGAGFIPDRVLGFEDSAAPAAALARSLGAAYETIEVHYFPDSECRVRIHGRARTPVVYRPLHVPNSKLIEILLAASALRDAGAADICLVAPYLPYMRQDIAFRPGEAISQKVVGGLLANAFDRFVAVDPHLHRTSRLSDVFGGKPALALSGASAMVAHLRARTFPAGTLVLGPDEESAPLIGAVAKTLGLSAAVAAKIRAGDREVAITLPPGLDVSQRSVIIVDDMITSGTTIATLARVLRDRGAASVEAYATHALFDDGAAKALSAAGVRRVVSCDGIPHPSNDMPLAGLIIEGLKSWR